MVPSWRENVLSTGVIPGWWLRGKLFAKGFAKVAHGAEIVHTPRVEPVKDLLCPVTRLADILNEIGKLVFCTSQQVLFRPFHE